MSKVAVVGLGVMGRGMAANLLKNGHEVVVWNRTASRAEEFVAAGAKAARTPAEAAAGGEAIPDPASFATAWAYKDVEYAARLGDSAGVPAHPILDGARALLAQAVADGHGQDDWSVVNKP
ncbi:hypothetical protein GCM10009789_49700 [Kribbella sancticallisti]|uniref:6-phosphogluconate dehydrogenase NADP-binding domain-containing protein n=1 Tax=Kribbella sancticallisti TaxID=460087 RepID=A0ABP4PSL0_9ACTN